MDTWVLEKLIRTEEIAYTPIGYTNNEIVMKYLNHLIKHSKAGPDKPWKILLLDGHESYHYKPF
jgi:hypothetical protein